MLSLNHGRFNWPVARDATRGSRIHFRQVNLIRSFSLPSGHNFESRQTIVISCEEKTGEKESNMETEAKEGKTCPKKKKKEKLGPKIEELPTVKMDKLENKDVEEKDYTKEKKKKWRRVDLSDFGFNMSLLPHPCKSSHINDEEVYKILDKIDAEYDEIEEKSSPFCHLEKYEGMGLENKYLRVDRDRKVRKAHKQIKDKYCQSVRNNAGRKTFYINHRVMKRMELEPERIYLHYPQPKRKDKPDIDIKKSSTNSAYTTNQAAPPQDLAHALYNQNIPGDLPTDLISLLINLQHRDLTPEDYEVLLRLDDSVAPKTVSENKLRSFKTDIVNDKSAGEMCSVCMEPYQIGQKRKFLPCEHIFHENCIDMWLKNSSMNCPLDGLPMDN